MKDRRSEFYLRLLFDADLRHRFEADRQRCMETEGLTTNEASVFLPLDAVGLEVDAQGRLRYLMSALCRPYVCSAGCLGALPGGTERLSRFLSRIDLLSAGAERTEAYGKWLEDSIDALVSEPAYADLVHAFLAWERALVLNSAQLRRAVSQGSAVPKPAPLKGSRAKKVTLTLPPFLIAVQLPQPPALLRSALGHIGPSNAWHAIASGQLDANRLRTVARAAAAPVTFLGRGVVRGMTHERAGAGGVAPLVDVSHITVEIPGLQAPLLAALGEGVQLKQLPRAIRPLVLQLCEAGLVVQRPD